MTEAGLPSSPASGQTPKSSLGRWLLFAPAGAGAFLLVGIFFVIAHALLGMTGARDQSLELLFENAVAASISSAVALAVSPAHRTRVAIFWVALIFSVACYGYLVNGAVVVPQVIAYRNI